MKDIVIDLSSENKEFYFISKLPVNVGNEFVLIPLRSILKFEADGYCTKIFTLHDSKVLVTTKNIGYYEKNLPSYAFFRVHNTFIVNLNHIEKIIRSKHWSIELSDGSKINISDDRKETLIKKLGFKPSY